MNSVLKTCFKCGTEKPLADFYAHQRMADGHLNKCKECACADAKGVRASNRDYYNNYDRQRATQEHRRAAKKKYLQSPAGRAVKARATANYATRHPLKRDAHIKVGNAIRAGKIQRQPCEVCGSETTQAHHDDYSKPFEIRWLCTTHHAQHHKRLRSH